MFTVPVDGILQQFIKMFYQMGIWQSDEESNYRKIGKKCFYIFIGALMPIFFATNAFLCDDHNETVFLVQAVVLLAVVYVKFLYLLFKKREILAFLYDAIGVHSIRKWDKNVGTSKKSKNFITFVRAYCLAFLIIYPLIIVSKLPIFSTDKGLPFFISFSWNDSETVY